MTAIDASVPTVTVADPRGNTWTVAASVNAASTTTLHLFVCRVATALLVGDVITVTSGTSVTRMAVGVEDFTDTTYGADKTATNTGSSASLSSGVTAATIQANELIVGAFALTNSGRTFTAAGSFTAATKVVSSGGSGDRAVVVEWKYVTSTGTQEATGTLNSSGGYAGAVATLKSVNDAPGVTALTAYEWNGTSLVALTPYRWTGAALESVTIEEH
jgi:hypothetical protein